MWRKSSEKFRYFAIWNILGTYFTIYLYISFHCEKWVSCCMTNPTKWPVHPVTTQISLGIRQPDPSHHCPHEETMGPSSYPTQRTAKTLSFCLFCHASAQMVLMNTAIFSFSNTDKLCPVILNYALLKHLTCEDLFTMPIIYGKYGLGWQWPMSHNTLTVAEWANLIIKWVLVQKGYKIIFY